MGINMSKDTDYKKLLEDIYQTDDLNLDKMSIPRKNP